MGKLLVELLPHASRVRHEREQVRQALEDETHRVEKVDRLVEELTDARRRNHFGENARKAMERKGRGR